MRRASPLLPSLLCLLTACHSGTGAAAPHRGGSRPGDPVPPGGVPTTGTKVDVTPPPLTPATTVSGRRRGMPHHGTITAVVTDAGGGAALSRDALGSVRIWPTLDGSREPQVVPVRAPEAMAIAARTDGSLAALIDGTGLATVLRFDGDGLVVASATLSPDVPLSGVVVLPGGERVAVVRSDQRIALLDADGAELSRLGMRGARVVALHVAGAGLVAVQRHVIEGVTLYEVRRLAITDDLLSWTGDPQVLPEAVAQLPHVASAVSPDGSLIAYVAKVKDSVEARIVQIDTGVEITLDATATVSVPASTTIGFTDAEHVELAGLGGNAWRIEIAGKTGTVISQAQSVGTSGIAFANNLRVSAWHAHLVLRADDGDLAYLGHRELAPSGGALAPSGNAAAWISSGGALVVQRFDGSDDVRIKGTRDWYGTVAMIDDDHLLAGRSNGELVLLDARTGAELASIVASQSTPWFVYEPTTRLLAVLRDTGVVWVMTVDPAAKKPLGAAISIGDGAQTFTLLDPAQADGDVLMTVDPQLTSRRYSLATLEDGVSAAEMKKEQVALGTNAWYFDRAGHHYAYSDQGIEVRDDTSLIRTIATTNGFGGLFVSPDGERLMILDGSGMGPVRVYDGAGKELWSLPTARNLFAASWASDAHRMMLVGQGGAAIVDTDTGEPVLTASGWAFARSSETPTALPQNVEPMFDL